MSNQTNPWDLAYKLNKEFYTKDQIDDYKADGDEYYAIHAQVIQMAVSKMYEQVKR